MSKQPGSFEREARETVVKSSLSGVAATVLAVTAFSPAGLGGMIGTSLASGGDTNSSATDNPYANLPPYAPPLTAQEISDIRGELAATEASMALTRAATEARIEQMRSIALTEGVVTFTAAPQRTAQVDPALRLTLSTPEAAPVEHIEVVAPSPLLTTADLQPISYSTGGGDVEYSTAPADPHLELAELFLAHASTY